MAFHQHQGPFGSPCPGPKDDACACTRCGRDCPRMYPFRDDLTSRDAVLCLDLQGRLGRPRGGHRDPLASPVPSPSGAGVRGQSPRPSALEKSTCISVISARTFETQAVMLGWDNVHNIRCQGRRCDRGAVPYRTSAISSGSRSDGGSWSREAGRAREHATAGHLDEADRWG